MVSYHHTISEKTNHPILKKLGDGRTDGQTDDGDFIGHCPTNVERLIYLVLVRTLQKRKNTPDSVAPWCSGYHYCTT